MRITELDKRRAIKRFPEFQKEYTRYNKLKTIRGREKFEIRFHEKWKFNLLKIIYADEVAKHRKDAPTVKAVKHMTKSPCGIVYKGEGEDRKPCRVYGEKLYLEVTIKDKTETQLIADFRREIAPYLKLLGTTDRRRGTDLKEGFWPIYDLYIKTDKNMVETTRQCFNVKGNPSQIPILYDDEFDEKYFKQFKQAVRHAETIINAVRQEYNLKLIKET